MVIWGLTTMRPPVTTNSQAETYNKTMIRYLASMLDNTMTLDWEEQLPAMMMAYNCHVQRATHETPFFLTYLHSPRLPYFDLEKPRLLYGEDWSSLAFTKMQTAFRQVKDCLLYTSPSPRDLSTSRMPSSA